MTRTSVGPLRYVPDPVELRAPAWFRKNTAPTPDLHEVEVGGASIRWLDWVPARQRRDTVLLVHGGAANVQWWAPLAPFLVRDGHRVVGMDLSGMGLSEWRTSYDVESWALEILAVADAIRTVDHPVTLVAHSLGGIVGAHAAVTSGSSFSRFIAVDSPVWNHAPAPESPVGTRASAPVRYYPDPEVAIARFTLIPEQRERHAWYVRHVAWHGLVRTDQGWTWRFDRRIFEGARGENRIARFQGDLAEVGCPTAVLMGEESYLTASARDYLGGGAGPAPLVLVPRAEHHVMLDEPLALVAGLRGLLAV